jgi:hypothetical protein
MIAVEIDFLIKVFPDNIVQLQERFRRQLPPRPAEAALGDLPDAELLIFRLL